eukprot:854917-Pyramimonas_sp.AAC.1
MSGTNVQNASRQRCEHPGFPGASDASGGGDDKGRANNDLGPLGIIWDLSGLFGTSRDYLGPLRIIWGLRFLGARLLEGRAEQLSKRIQRLPSGSMA